MAVFIKKHYHLSLYLVSVNIFLKYHIPKNKYLDEVVTDNTLKNFIICKNAGVAELADAQDLVGNVTSV